MSTPDDVPQPQESALKRWLRRRDQQQEDSLLYWRLAFGELPPVPTEPRDVDDSVEYELIEIEGLTVPFPFPPAELP